MGLGSSRSHHSQAYCVVAIMRVPNVLQCKHVSRTSDGRVNSRPGSLCGDSCRAVGDLLVVSGAACHHGEHKFKALSKPCSADLTSIGSSAGAPRRRPAVRCSLRSAPVLVRLLKVLLQGSQDESIELPRPIDDEPQFSNQGERARIRAESVGSLSPLPTRRAGSRRTSRSKGPHRSSTWRHRPIPVRHHYSCDR